MPYGIIEKLKRDAFDLGRLTKMWQKINGGKVSTM